MAALPAARARTLVRLLFAMALGVTLRAESVFTSRPDDPRAVDFTGDACGAHGDGVSDDADALQTAIDRVQETTRMGVVLIPEGRYRLGRTVRVWSGIRLIGYGKRRPVFVLGRDTPGFQDGAGRSLIQFMDNRPPPGEPLVDGTEFTFYSGMNNIDFELQDGNSAAIAVRFHVAQHGVLTHMDFRIGSARAALEDIGNQASDIHVYGGEYGIITRRTAPVWQFLLMDSTFDGQRAAAIHTMEAGMTLVRVRISNTPVALQVAPGEVEQLYARDLRLENIRDAALVAGNWRNPHSAIFLTDVACSNVSCFYRGEPPILAPGVHYVMEEFSLGLDIGRDGREQGIQVHHRERALAQATTAVASDVPALPPVEAWTNVRTIGAKGDGATDDTTALRGAIAQHRVLYFPSGIYRVSDTLELKPDTVLIGLNPGTTQISLADGAVAFGGEGGPIGVVVAPPGGRNVVSSLTIATGVRNPRAAGVIWRASAASLLDDVSFPVRAAGAPFSRNAAGSRGPVVTPGSVNAGPAPAARPPGGFPRGPNYSNTQAADLIVTDNGGGLFRGIWAHNTNSSAGLRIENTTTPGRIYQISIEHHLRIEAQLHRLRGWEFYALQTEEENPAGAEAGAIDIESATNLLLANTFLYRVSRNVRPKAHAIVVHDSRRLEFQNVKVFSQTRLAFDNAVFDEAGNITVRPHFFTRFTIDEQRPAAAPIARPVAFAPHARLEQLATGFSNAAGLTTSDSGALFFTDAANQKVYRWNESAKKAELLADLPVQPQVLGFVPPSHLLAVANERAVYHLHTAGDALAEPVPEAGELQPDTILFLPVGLHNPLWVLQDMLAHRGYVFRPGSNTAVVHPVPDEHRGYYYAPGTRTAIMAGGTWRPNLQSSQLAAFGPGDSRYLTSEDDSRTYLAKLGHDRSLSTTVFVERGGTSVVSDAAGHVYLAEGQVWIYDRSGREIGVLEIPERPGSLAFGGADQRTLFIGARSSLYAIRTAAPGASAP